MQREITVFNEIFSFFFSHTRIFSITALFEYHYYNHMR